MLRGIRKGLPFPERVIDVGACIPIGKKKCNKTMKVKRCWGRFILPFRLEPEATETIQRRAYGSEPRLYSASCRFSAATCFYLYELEILLMIADNSMNARSFYATS